MHTELPRGYDGSDEGPLATAAWFNPVELNVRARNGSLAYSANRMWLGRTLDDDALPVGYADDRHWLTIAGSRAGKGISAIIPVLSQYNGSILCVDVKGENADATAARRGSGTSSMDGLLQDVHVLDPFETSNVNEDDRSSFNPLTLIDPASAEAVEDAALIADALVVSAKAEDAHWDDSAKNWLTALILHVVSWPKFSDRTLGTVRRLLLEGDVDEATYRAEQKEAEEPAKREPPFKVLLVSMATNDAFDGIIASSARAFFDLGERERSSILSTARRNTAFLDSKAMQACLRDGDRRLNLDELKTSTRGVSVYLVLPARRMATHARWLRLILNLAVSRLEAVPGPPAKKTPVLAVLDEMNQLGHMPILESAAGYMAGFGLRLWSIWQDLGQLKRHYPQSFETFIANASVVTVFGLNDLTTTDYIAKRLGEMVLRTVSSSSTTSGSTSTADLSAFDKSERAEAPGVGERLRKSLAMEDATETTTRTRGKSSATSTSLTKTPLLTADEIARCFARETGLQLVLISGMPPIALKRSNYREDELFLDGFELQRLARPDT
jgi:type IV secretion system protein VirD4